MKEIASQASPEEMGVDANSISCRASNTSKQKQPSKMKTIDTHVGLGFATGPLFETNASLRFDYPGKHQIPISKFPTKKKNLNTGRGSAILVCGRDSRDPSATAAATT